MRSSDWGSDLCSSDLTTMTGADGGEGMALSSAGDDGLNSILGGILGAGVGGGHAYDEVLGSFGLDTGGMIGGIVTGLDEFLIRGGDGKDTISGDALASGKTGIAEANNKRSEEHTSELQSLMRISYAVFCLKKKKTN